MGKKRYSLKKSLKHLLDNPGTVKNGIPGGAIKEHENDASECNLKKSEADFRDSFLFT